MDWVWRGSCAGCWTDITSEKSASIPDISEGANPELLVEVLRIYIYFIECKYKSFSTSVLFNSKLFTVNNDETVFLIFLFIDIHKLDTLNK